MGVPYPSPSIFHSPASGRPTAGPDRPAVLKELDAILAGDAFANSARSKQFLSFVVRQKLEGREDLLKERTLGTELFQRRPGYSTGDDPIVRVQAGEVRRRLERHYDTAGTSGLRIELPVGSYVPEFHVARPRSPQSFSKRLPRLSRKPSWMLLAIAAVLIAAVVIDLRLKGTETTAHLSIMAQFWAPALSSSQPVVICASKPVLYRPSLRLYQQYSKNHPGRFQTEVERLNEPLPLDPNQPILWKDMMIFPELGVAAGDAYAAFRIAGLLGNMNKGTQFRIANEPSFDDLGNFPAVIIGAFSKRWTSEATSNLRYAFNEKEGNFWIEDRNSPRDRWFTSFNSRGEIVQDFAITSRLLNSKTGQLVIAVAGIQAAGSDAAAQLISNPMYLADALHSAPTGWKNKNIQFVVKTEVVDSVAGPPQIVAAYFW